MNRFPNPHMPNQMVYPNTSPTQQYMQPNMPQQYMQPNMQQQHMYPGMMQQPMQQMDPRIAQHIYNTQLQQQHMNSQMMQSQMHPGMMQQPMQSTDSRYMQQPMQPNIPAHFRNNTSVPASFSNNVPVSSVSRFESTSSDNFESKTMNEETFEVNKNEQNTIGPGITVNNITDPIDRHSVYIHESNFIAETEESAVDDIIYNYFLAKQRDSRDYKAIQQKAFINNVYYDINLNNEIIKWHSLDYDQMFKEMATFYHKNVLKRNVYFLDVYSKRLTSLVNAWLYINTLSRVSIDNILFDFNDLISFLMSNENHAITGVYNVIEQFRKKWKNCSELMSCIVFDEEEIKLPTSNIFSSYTMVYIDKFDVELGLKNMISKIPVFIVKRASNELFLIMSKNVFNETDDFFYKLVTLNKSVYTIYRNERNDYFIEKQ